MKPCTGDHKFVAVHMAETDDKNIVYLVCEKCGKQIKKSFKK